MITFHKLVDKVKIYFNQEIKPHLVKYFNRYLYIDLMSLANKSENVSALIELLHTDEFIYKRNKVIRKFLLSLFRNLENSLNNLYDFRPLNTNKQVYILHVSVWGKKYADKMVRYLIPSLLAPNNIPSISKDYSVTLWVHCDQVSFNRLKKDTATNQLNKFINIKYDVIPKELYNGLKKIENNFIIRIGQKILRFTDFKYYLLGSMQNIAMLTAQKNQALFSFLMPDFLFSGQSIYKMCELIRSGYKAILGGAFRSASDKVFKSLPRYGTNNELVVSGKELSRIVVNTMHIAARERIVSNANININLCPQLIFIYPNEVVVRALHSHPLLVDFTKIKSKLTYGYLPVDNELILKLVDSEFTYESQLYVIEKPEEISFMEISDNDAEEIIERRSYYHKPILEHVADYISLSGWDKVNLFLLSKRCIYNSSPSNDLLMSDISDTKLIDPLISEKF